MAEKISLADWDALQKWTQNYYKYSPTYKITGVPGNYNCQVNYAAWGTAEGCGPTKDAAKAAAAKEAWRQIDEGEFIGDNFDIEIFEAWQAGEKISKADAMMKYIVAKASETDEEE